ncbi:hypothetical protein ACIBJC_25690 [Streptomyces sp. NPDC050509]|uniref:hypothetical protein n=1 Tax=Streptomyces sp. NPDC050509 TaxID=3365620 RepID=UPI0037A507DA
MSVLLYRLGHFAYARPWYVIAGWLAVVSAVVALLVVNPVKLSNEVRIDGTPAQEVIDDLAKWSRWPSGRENDSSSRTPPTALLRRLGNWRISSARSMMMH